MAGKPISRCYASGVAYEGGRTNGRVQVIPSQSGVTACSHYNNNSSCSNNFDKGPHRRGGGFFMGRM